jgi:hypothetical protein
MSYSQILQEQQDLDNLARASEISHSAWCDELDAQLARDYNLFSGLCISAWSQEI